MDQNDENEYSDSDNDSVDNEDTDQSDNESVGPKNIITSKTGIIGTNIVNVEEGEDIEDEDEDVSVDNSDIGDDTENEDEGSDEDEEEINAVDTKNDTFLQIPSQIMNIMSLSQPNNTMVGDDDEDDEDEFYLQKFDAAVNKNYIAENHPECLINNYDEISMLTTVIRDAHNNIIDPLHKTIPFLTKYEKARVLGQRAKQINSGAKAFVKIPDNVIDGYLIAEIELMQKRIPFIIRRPISGTGCEYWNLKDLEIIGF